MFVVPGDLTQFSIAGLEDLRRVALTELRTRRAAITDPAQISDEDLAELKALHQFSVDAGARIADMQARAAEFSALEAVEAPVVPAEPAPVEAEPVATQVTPGNAITAANTTTTTTVTAVRIAELAPLAPQPEIPVAPTPEGLGEFHALVASADVPGFSTGAELRSWREFATAFVNRTRSYSGESAMRHPVAEIRREFPRELTVTENMTDTDTETILQYARDETRLPGGSLVAANGWCSPSETLYGTCLQITTDGLLSLPEVVARRGGIRHTQGIEFDAIFGTGTGFNELTEAQVIANTSKTCLEIPCPPFVDDRLKVTALCLTGSILQNRAYPEFVETFVRGAIATYAHFQNREIIADLVAGSGAPIVLSPIDPWLSDQSVVSQVLGAVEMAVVDIRYRLRLAQSATLEVIFPFWLKALFRQDFSRRTGFDGVGLADAQIDAWLAQRGVRAQYVYDWQDAFSGVATGPGADTPILTLPALVASKVLQFAIFPAGTWMLARQDVIRLESIYDSVNLPQNRVTQLFMEDGWAVMRMCPLSRVYQITLCPSGATGALRAVECDTIA